MRSAIIVKTSFAIVMHMFLFGIHMANLKTGTITLAKAYDLIYPILLLVIFNIMIIADFANSAVSLRQPNNKLQGTWKNNRYKNLSRWICHGLSVVIEMCSIAWFIMKYNIIYQYITYLARKWIQGENICKTISSDIANNKYVMKLIKGFKDTTVANFLILSAMIVVSFATTNHTISRTIISYRI